MKHIVIIHIGAIGDLVQAMPALRAVRAAWPEGDIALLGRPERAILAETAGLVDRRADLETSGLWRLLAEHPSDVPAPPALDGADLVLDFLSAGALDAARLARKPGRPPARIVSVNPLPPGDWKGPAAAWILGEAARQLDLPPVPVEPEIPVPAAALGAARTILADRGIRGPFAAIHPGSGSRKKNWPLHRFAALADRLRQEGKHAVVWLAGPAELERGTVPTGGSRDALLSDLPLDRVAGVLALADAYLGNDSGITQVAAAVRRPAGRATPTVALFGPTSADVWAPRGGHVRVIRSPNGTMEGIGAEEVWQRLTAALG